MVEGFCVSYTCKWECCLQFCINCFMVRMILFSRINRTFTSSSDTIQNGEYFTAQFTLDNVSIVVLFFNIYLLIILLSNS